MMQKIKPMVDMEIAEEAQETNATPSMYPTNKYPYGLCISLTQKELDKLDVDHTDWSVGDMFHLHCMAKVTSISSNETTEGQDTRVEMQIIMMSGESEDEENEEDGSSS